MGEEKSKSRGWCGWFIALIVLAAVILAVVYMVKSKMKKSDDGDGAGPVPGPPGAIDKKYADALKLSLQFFDIQKCNKTHLFLICRSEVSKLVLFDYFLVIEFPFWETNNGACLIQLVDW